MTNTGQNGFYTGIEPRGLRSAGGLPPEVALGSRVLSGRTDLPFPRHGCRSIYSPGAILEGAPAAGLASEVGKLADDLVAQRAELAQKEAPATGRQKLLQAHLEARALRAQARLRSEGAAPATPCGGGWSEDRRLLQTSAQHFGDPAEKSNDLLQSHWEAHAHRKEAQRNGLAGNGGVLPGRH